MAEQGLHMENNKPRDLNAPEEDAKVQIHYVKSNYFRVIHVSGAQGGLTPVGEIFVSVYNDRSPIPQATTHQIMPNGRLGGEILEERISKGGMVREVEAGLLMDIGTAETLHRWLGKQLELVRKIIEEAKRGTTTPSGS
jgi:hypothetical protein